MKFIWENSDIVPARQIRHFSGQVYTIVSVDSLTKKNVGYALLADHRVTPTYTTLELVQLLNEQSCTPLSL